MILGWVIELVKYIWDSRRETIETRIEAPSRHANRRKKYHIANKREVGYGA